MRKILMKIITFAHGKSIVMKKIIITIIGVAACLYVTVTCWRKLSEEYEVRKQEWHSMAVETFRETLLMEVDKMSEIPFYSYTSEGKGGVKTLKTEIPDSVHITSQYGRRSYRLQKERFKHQLLEGGRMNSSLSYLILFSGYSIETDTLIQRWDSLLARREVPVSTSLRYALTDLLEHTDTVYSHRERFVAPLDSALVWYLGLRCEAELAGCIRYPSFARQSETLTSVGMLSLLWIVLLAFLCYYNKVEAYVKRKFTRKEIVHVADAQIKGAKIYHLGGDAIYEVFTQTIRKGEVQHRLAPQSGILFVLFLRTPGHRVMPDDINRSLWKGEGTKERIHSAIRRLRNELKSAPVELEIDFTGDAYQLKSPISSIETSEKQLGQ